MSTIPFAFLPQPRLQFLDANGVPLAGGFLFSYAAGSSVAQATYHLDTLGNLTPNPNPIILDATGTCEVRIQPLSYKFVLQNSSGVQVWAVDQVQDIGSLFANAVVLNPVGAALQTIAGPLSVTQILVGGGAPLVTSDQTGTGKLVLQNSPTIVSPSINCLKATNAVTQTGDALLHTIYTIPIPGGLMGINNQMRITLLMKVNVSANNPLVLFNYGGSVISTSGTISSLLANSTGIIAEVIGGNIGATNSQSWDTVRANYLSTSSPGTIDHQTSAIDSTVTQNITVTYQGGAGSDSITFYRCIVEIL